MTCVLRPWVFAILIPITFLGCGGGGAAHTPEQVCLDLASAFEDLCLDRCEMDPRVCYLMSAPAALDCANVKKIRSIGLLYGTCIPWSESVDCDYARSEHFELDMSCREQLIKDSP